MRAVILALVLGACITPASVFECASNAECSGGLCQLDVGFCSFANSECPSGQAYGPASGDLSNDCVPVTAICGNSVVETGEDCEDGNAVDTDGCVGCQLASCGDGKVRAGIEDCDDGNTTDGDACNSICITCEGDDVVVANGHCYMKLDAALGWEAARSDCVARGGFLAAINSAAENAVVADLLDSGGDYWFGMSHFVTGTFFGEDDDPSAFMNFAGGEPDGGGAEDCISISDATGQWADRNCGQTLPYVCEKTPWTIDPASRHAYLYVGSRPAQGDYDQARDACVARTGHLVTIADATEQGLVDAITGATTVWIGMNDKVAEGTLVWETGEPTTFMNFETGQPDNQPNFGGSGADCVTIGYPLGQWHDDECSTPFDNGYICEIDP